MWRSRIVKEKKNFANFIQHSEMGHTQMVECAPRVNCGVISTDVLRLQTKNYT